jgi:hypothetical protein
MDFLKKLFSREPEEVTLNQIELKGWLEEKSEDILKDEIKTLKEILSKAKDSKIHLKEKIELLEKAELMNRNIPDREVHIMQGNRTNYTNKMYSFIEDTKLPEPDFEKIESFCEEFQKTLLQLNEETGKGYFVLKNFFDKDVVNIASSIKEIEDYIKELKSVITQEKISKYRKMLLKIRELNETSIKKESLSEEVKKLDEEIKATEAKKMNFETKLKNLKEGQEFQMHLRMETEKNDLEEGLKKLESRLINIIKPLDKPIKKISHDTGNRLLQKYLDDPLKTLIEDNDLEILTSIAAIRQEIESDAEVKDKQKEKLLGYIEEMKRETLEQIKKEHNELLSHKTMVEEILSRSSMVMDMKELDYQIEHVTEKLKRIEQENKEKNIMLDKLKVEDKSKKLEEELSEFTGKKISISNN